MVVTPNSAPHTPPPIPDWLMSGSELERVPPGPLRVFMAGLDRDAHDVAATCGVDVGAIRRVIYDEARMTITQAERIAEALGVEPSAIWADWTDITNARVWEPTPWARSGSCRGEDTGLFFAPAGERPETRVTREWHALRICRDCPVVDDCRAYARRNREYGVWGGETEEARALAGFAPTMPIGHIARIATYRRTFLEETS